MEDFGLLRQRMVDNQIRPSAVSDHQVIQAFLSVPRERFVGAEQRAFAYADRDIPLPSGASGRRMMPPVVLARLVQALEVGPGARTLVVAAGTGYSAAILTALGAEVIALEEDADMANEARAALGDTGFGSVEVVSGKHVRGYPKGAPYDLVLVDGGIEILPDAIAEQLAEEGRLAVIEVDGQVSRAMLYERVGATVTKWPLFDAWLDVLPGFERTREFVF